ncbi:hypothetical protein [Sphaerochaeta halotolerans]|uniref:hypothetical protein n=1 Tax=Sphaerochaeta halotolerans TaxID=2293840 RepID=UPI0010586F1A|nr:hypothetical protein [Sphaerochaeta halotolerans]
MVTTLDIHSLGNFFNDYLWFLLVTNMEGMKDINTPGQAMDSGGVASFSAPRDGVSHLAFPALAPERNLPADSFPLAPLGNENRTGRSHDARVQ